MSNPRLLISYAHPDDESFGQGGLIGKYVAQGIDVYLICATDGDVGTVPEDMRDQYDSIRELRLAELDCACDVLGFKEVFKFGYKDSGMMGSETTQDPDSLWYNHEHHPEQVTRRVVEVMRQIQPHVVLTFNKYGGYGHPDHIAIQRATTEAFHLAGDPDYITPGYQPYQPQKLYYSAFPKWVMQLGLFQLRLVGQDPRRMGVNKDIDFVRVVENCEPIHTRVDIADYYDIWDQSSACHKSQGGGGNRSFFGLPAWTRKVFFRKQGYTRVVPQPPADRVDEDDLFEGVTVDVSQPEYAG